VPIHGHALSNGNHSGNVWGIATEAYNHPSKTGGLGTQIFGAEFTVANFISTSTSVRHAGLLLTFKNRLDAHDTPVNGVPAGGNAYNKNTSAILLDAGAGRIGSSSNLALGNPAIECGWNKGMYFGATSLDSAAGVKAVGIDFTALDTPAPEGGKYTARVKSFLAVPSDGAISFASDMFTSWQRFNSSLGTLEFMCGNEMRLAIGLGSGTLYLNSADFGEGAFGYTKYIDIAGRAPAFASISSNGGKTNPPTNTGAPVSWVRLIIDGVSGCIPWYQ
jgi:hypothetical protein